MTENPKILPGTGRWQSEGLAEGSIPQPSAPPPASPVPLPVPGRNSSLAVRDQFPAIVNWHYLDSAATAQKPQAVIDAVTEAYSRDYATVHRGVYERSATMTDAYERSRAAASKLIGGLPNELIFTRGATEAINLVARALPKDGRNRVLLSQLEHHSNIVPWQLAGYEVV